MNKRELIQQAKIIDIANVNLANDIDYNKRIIETLREKIKADRKKLAEQFEQWRRIKLQINKLK